MSSLLSSSLTTDGSNFSGSSIPSLSSSDESLVSTPSTQLNKKHNNDNILVSSTTPSVSSSVTEAAYSLQHLHLLHQSESEVAADGPSPKSSSVIVGKSAVDGEEEAAMSSSASTTTKTMTKAAVPLIMSEVSWSSISSHTPGSGSMVVSYSHENISERSDEPFEGATECTTVVTQSSGRTEPNFSGDGPLPSMTFNCPTNSSAPRQNRIFEKVKEIENEDTSDFSMSTSPLTKKRCIDSLWVKSRGRAAWAWLSWHRKMQICLALSCSICLIFLVIILPVLICVVIPAIVREAVKDSELKLERVTIREPQDDSFILDAFTTLHRKTTIPATISELPLGIFWPRSLSQMGHMTIPEMEMKGNMSESHFSVAFYIDDQEVWDNFLRELIQKGKAEWQMLGDATVHCLGMTFGNLIFEKVIEVKGPPIKSTSSLSTTNMEERDSKEELFRVTDFDLSTSTPEKVLFSAQVEYLNIGLSSIDPVGDIYFDIWYNEVYIGKLITRGVSVLRGRNKYGVTGSLDPWTQLEGLDGLEKEEMSKQISYGLGNLTSRAMRNEMTILQAVGTGGSIPLYDAALKQLNLSTPLKGLKGLGEGSGELIGSMKFETFELLPIPGKPNKVEVQSRIVAFVKNPLGANSPMLIDKVKLSGDLNDGSSTGPLLGYLTATLSSIGVPEISETVGSDDEISANSEVMKRSSRLRMLGESEDEGESGLMFHAVMQKVLFLMMGDIDLVDEGKLFTEVVKRLIRESVADIALVNTVAEAQTRSALGSVVLTGLDLDRAMPMKGFGGMSDVRIEVYRFTKELPDGSWGLEATVVMPSSAPIRVYLGDMMLEMEYEGVYLGIIRSENVLIETGDNKLNFVGKINPHPKDLPFLSEFFSAYLSGRNATMGVRVVESEEDDVEEDRDYEDPKTQPLKWIRDSLTDLEMNFNLSPPKSGKSGSSFLRSATTKSFELKPIDNSHVNMKGVAEIEAYSPLGAQVEIIVNSIGISAQLQTSKGNVLGHVFVQPVKPKSQTSGGETLLVVWEFEGILDVEGEGEAFATLFQEMQSQDIVPLKMMGGAQIHVNTSLGVMSLQDVTVDTEMKLKGFGDSLESSAKFGELKFTGSKSETGSGIGFISTLSLDMPSQFSMSLGEVYFYLNYEGATLGTLAIHDLRLTSEEITQEYKMNGWLNPRGPDALEKASDLFSRYIAGDEEEATIEVRGMLAELSDQLRPSWLQYVIKSLVMKVKLPPMSDLLTDSFSNVAMSDIQLKATLPPSTYEAGVAISADVDTNINSPFGESSPIYVRQVSLRLTMDHEDGSEGFPSSESVEREGEVGGETENEETATIPLSSEQRRRLIHLSNSPHHPRRVKKQRRLSPTSTRSFLSSISSSSPVGYLIADGIPVHHRNGTEKVKISLRDLLLVFSDGGVKFGDLAIELMQSKKNQSLVMSGEIDIVVDTDMGRLMLNNLQISFPFTFKGIGILDRSSSQENIAKLGHLQLGDFDEVGLKAIKLSTSFMMKNPSDVTVELGTIVLDIFYGENLIAAVAVPHFALRAGETTFEALGAVKPQDLSIFSEFVSFYLASKPMTLKMRGVSSPIFSSLLPSGTITTASPSQIAYSLVETQQQSVPLWVQRILAVTELELPLNPSGDQDEANSLSTSQFVESVNLANLLLDVSTAGNPLVEADVKVSYKFPPQLALQHRVLSIDTSLDTYRILPETIDAENDGRVLLGKIVIEKLQPLREEEGGGDSTLSLVTEDANLRFRINGTKWAVSSQSSVDVSSFFSDVLHTEGFSTIEVMGSGDVLLLTALGEIMINDIPMSVSQEFEHFGGLDNHDNEEEFFDLSNMSIISGTEHGLVMESRLSLNLPGSSKIGVKVGSMLLDIFFPATGMDPAQFEDSAQELFQTHPQFGQIFQIGMVKIPHFQITPGMPYKMFAQAVLLRPVKDSNGSFVRFGPRVLLSNYINGFPTNLYLMGNAQSVVNPLLSGTFKNLASSMELPGSTGSLMKSVDIDLKFVKFFPIIEAKTMMENPMPVPIAIHYANMTSYSGEKILGVMNANYLLNPVVIPPFVVKKLPPVKVVPKFEGGGFQAFRKVLSGKSKIKVKGEMEIAIGTYVAQLDVEISDIPVSL